jgi:hypothetical protein
MLQFDALRTEFYEVAVGRDAGCAVCGDASTIMAPVEYDLSCALHASAESLRHA